MPAAHDVIKASFAAWNARDADGFSATFTPDGVIRVPEAVPYGGTWRGREAIAGFARDLWAFSGEMRAVVDRLIGDGDEVIARGHHLATTPDGVEHRLAFVNALTIRDGLIADLRQQLDAGEVVTAVAAKLAGDGAAPPRAEG